MVRKSRRTSPPEQRNSTTPFANAYSMLELYFRQNSLPKFELKVVEQRDSFFCTILFEGDTYRSYPDVFTTEIQARDRAAFKLLEKLGAATKQSLQSPEAQPLTRPQLKMDTPEQIDSVVTKLLKMLEKKPTGIFCHAVAQLFAEDFDAELSGDWMKKIEGDRRLEIRSNGMAPVLYKTTAQIRSWTQKSLTIPELSFPPGGADVFVTNIISANHFCGLVDRESRQKMESQLNAFYSQENVSSRLKLQPFEEPVVGTSYATLAVGWCRAQCVEKRSESEAAKFRFIDCGAIREIPNDRIYHLADVFYSFPYFLIDFSLQEFANIDESEAKDPEILAEIRRLILLKPVRVVPTPGCDLSARPLPVRVYSKSDSDSGGNSNQLSSCVDVNSRLYRLFATPAINYPTGCSEAYLTNVSPDGTFFLQIEGFGLQEFRRLTIEPSKDVCVGKVLFDEVYCARLKESWSRCVVTQIASHQEIGIEFIDYGIEDTVSIEEIFPLKLIEHLEDLPPQALRTHLTNVIPYSSWNNGDIGEITQICPLNQKLVVERSKVTHCRKRFCDLNILHVEIFKPIESGNRLVSVNAEVYRKLRKLA